MTTPLERATALLALTSSSVEHEALSSLRLLHQHNAKHGLKLVVVADEPADAESPGVGTPPDPIDRVVQTTERIANAGERIVGVASRVGDILSRVGSLFPKDEEPLPPRPHAPRRQAPKPKRKR